MACTPELNRLLFDLLGAETLNSTTEDQLLQHIMPVMVRRLHKKNLTKLSLDETEREGVDYTFHG